MTKLTFHLIFLDCLPSILIPELNFDSDELLSGKKIVFLYIPLAVVADILFVKILASQFVLLSMVNLLSL